jgi:hypothetical protein
VHHYKLTLSPEEEAKIREASDLGTPPARLVALREGLRARFSSAVAEALLRNPNTPIPTLLELSNLDLQALLENPAFPLLLLERPGLLCEVSPVVLFSRWEQLTPEQRLSLFSHPASQVRAEVASRVALPPERFEALSRESDRETGHGLLRNPHLPEALRERLLQRFGPPPPKRPDWEVFR